MTVASVAATNPPGSDRPAGDDGIVIGLAPASAADDAALVSQLAALVNEAYAEAERDIFVPGYRRASEDEMGRFIRQGSLALARRSPSSSGGGGGGQEAVGCVLVRRLSPTTGDLSMLALAAEHRGRGLGRRLVGFAEDWCRGLGCTTMQLQLLVPTSFEHGLKLRMQAWYLRMGYRIVGADSFQRHYPALAPLLAGPADYRVFEKAMGSSSSSSSSSAAAAVSQQQQHQHQHQHHQQQQQGGYEAGSSLEGARAASTGQ